MNPDKEALNNTDDGKQVLEVTGSTGLLLEELQWVSSILSSGFPIKILSTQSRMQALVINWFSHRLIP